MLALWIWAPAEFSMDLAPGQQPAAFSPSTGIRKPLRCPQMTADDTLSGKIQALQVDVDGQCIEVASTAQPTVLQPPK